MGRNMIDIRLKRPLNIEIRTRLNQPVDLLDANATEDDVLLGKTFYAQTKKLKTGRLTAYDVWEEIIGENVSRLVIKTLGAPTTDLKIIKENIEIMKSADYTEIVENGGTLANTEEYEQAEEEFQLLAQKIMGVII